MTTSFTHELAARRIVFGEQKVACVGEELDRLGGKRVLVLGRSDLGREQLGSRAVAEFTDIRPHVPIEVVSVAADRAHEARADCLLAIGGGSTIGLAKALAVDIGLPIVAVPTTYSGSEMTSIHGRTDGDRKLTGNDPRAAPRTVIYDPTLTIGLPAAVTAGSGINAVAHCVEALYGVRGPVVRAVTIEGMATLVQALPKATATPKDITARSNCLLGAYLAGWALAASEMAIHHRICHAVGGMSRAPHGDINSVVLPYAVAFNAQAAKAETNEVAQLLEVNDAATGLQLFSRGLGTPESLRDIGVKERSLSRIADAVVSAPLSNPREATAANVLELLRSAFRGDPVVAA